MVNDSKREQITRDHSLVEEMIRRGGIDRKSARNHPDKNIITRAIGAEDAVTADFFHVELKPGDIVLMCSDGLTNMLEDEEIHMILSSQEGVETKAEELVKAANSNGGRDNIAVILIEPPQGNDPSLSVLSCCHLPHITCCPPHWPLPDIFPSGR